MSATTRQSIGQRFLSALRQPIAVLTGLSWGFFLLVDYHLQKVVAQAVADRSGTYGELYGPLSFFRFLLLIISLALTIAAICFLLLRRSNVATSTAAGADREAVCISSCTVRPFAGLHHDILIGSVCAFLGAVHAALMAVYVQGPELAPLAVYLVDFPVALPLIKWLSLPEMPALWTAIMVCSVLYPIALFLIVRLLMPATRHCGHGDRHEYPSHSSCC